MLNRRSFLRKAGGITASAAALSLTFIPSIVAADAGRDPHTPQWLSLRGNHSGTDRVHTDLPGL
jgi:hypothetical protein